MSELDTDLWDREDDQLKEELSHPPLSKDLYEEEDEEDEEWEEEIPSELVDFFEDEEQSLMDSARIRLEQGRLYEMLIKHDLFDGVDAMPEAVDKVQKEIKDYIMDRLEILLGMKAEKETEIHHVVQQSQFNDLEVQALKMIASKVTKGASVDAPTTPQKVENELNTIKKTSPTPRINALGKKVNKQIVKEKIGGNGPFKKKQKRQVLPTRKLKQEAKELSTKGLSAEAIAKRDLKYIESLKSMSLEEADRVVAERHNRPRARVNIDQNVVNSHYQTRMATNETANVFTALLANAKKK